MTMMDVLDRTSECNNDERRKDNFLTSISFLFFPEAFHLSQDCIFIFVSLIINEVNYLINLITDSKVN